MHFHDLRHSAAFMRDKLRKVNPRKSYLATNG
jgi:hypothetical protein